MIIKHVNIVTNTEILNDYCIEIRDGKIHRICKDIIGNDYIDGKGRYLSAGFVDIHIHGGGGYDFMDDSTETYENITYAHMIHGTTSMMPTLLPAPTEEIKKAIDKYNNASKYYTNLLGIHLEGPYINSNQAGAINKQYIEDPNIYDIEQIIDYANGSISRVTIAPELNGAIDVISYLNKKDITISIGHSDANIDAVRSAYKNGANLITHLYSACSSITRKNGYRILGIIEAAYLIDDMNIEVIADGSHLPKELLQYICKFKNLNNIALITDAMRAAGTNVKESYLGKLENGTPCIIEDGVAKLTDRSAFAGSIATTDILIRNIINAGISLVDAIKMVTINPIKMLGNKYNKGQIKEGFDADLVMFDKDINVSFVMVNGDILYEKNRLHL